MRKYSNLVELSREYIREHISKDEFKEAVKEIEIFQPIEDDVDDTVYYNGNKNLWDEFTTNEYTYDITSGKYKFKDVKKESDRAQV